MISRRAFLARTVGLSAIGATATLVSGAFPSGAVAASTQPNWRRCKKCSTLFFNGYRPKTGRCPGSGKHEVAGRFDYVLVFDDSRGPGQGDWRFCNKCMALFFNGYSAKGVCPAGGGHQAAGYNFFLFHDRRPSGKEEDLWRFCNKCQVLFYTQASETSVCAASGRHVAAGYKFLLTIQGGGID